MAWPRKAELSDLIGLFNIWFLWQKTLNHYPTKKTLLSLFMFFCGLNNNSLNVFQHVVYFNSAFWDHTGQCCKPINRDHLEKKYFMLQVKVGNVSACTISGSDTEGKIIKWKKIISQNQDKGSLVKRPTKGELQVIPYNVFLLILMVVLQNRFNDSSKATCGVRKCSSLEDWRCSSWGRQGCLGTGRMQSRDKSGCQHWLHNRKGRHQLQPWYECAWGFVPLLNMCTCITAAVVTSLSDVSVLWHCGLLARFPQEDKNAAGLWVRSGSSCLGSQLQCTLKSMA